MKPKFGSTGIIIAIFAVLIGVGIFFSIGDSEGSSSGSDIFSQSFGSSGIGSGLTLIFSVLLVIAVIAWVIHMFRSESTEKVSESKEGEVSESKDETSENNKILLDFFGGVIKRVIINPARTVFRVIKPINPLKNSKRNIARAEKILKAAIKKRENVINKLQSISTEEDVGRIRAVRDSRRQSYAYKIMTAWEKEFEIEKIGNENFETYSERVIKHLESKVNELKRLLVEEENIFKITKEEKAEQSKEAEIYESIYGVGEDAKDIVAMARYPEGEISEEIIKTHAGKLKDLIADAERELLDDLKEDEKILRDEQDELDRITILLATVTVHSKNGYNSVLTAIIADLDKLKASTQLQRTLFREAYFKFDKFRNEIIMISQNTNISVIKLLAEKSKELRRVVVETTITIKRTTITAGELRYRLLIDLTKLASADNKLKPSLSEIKEDTTEEDNAEQIKNIQNKLTEKIKRLKALSKEIKALGDSQKELAENDPERTRLQTEKINPLLDEHTNLYEEVEVDLHKIAELGGEKFTIKILPKLLETRTS